MQDSLFLAAGPRGTESGTYLIINSLGHGDKFFVRASGRLLCKRVGKSFTYSSHDASGAFHLRRTMDGVEIDSTLNFHNGVVTGHSENVDAYSFGYRFPPTWAGMTRIELAHPTLPLAALMDVISAASIGIDLILTEEAERLMVGLALCKPEFLAGKNPIDAWAILGPEHVQAITRWAR